jgi:hypothetical protein
MYFWYKYYFISNIKSAFPNVIIFKAFFVTQLKIKLALISEKIKILSS